MMDQESKRPVTVEDLLRFKRAERPAQEFWSQFEQELRAKQLAALVEKRPWWRSWPRRVVGAARFHLPLGATAVLAVTLLSVRDYHPVLRETPSDPATAMLPVEDETETSVPEAAVAIAAQPRSEPAAVVATVAPRHTEPARASIENAPGELARLVPLLSSGPSSASADLGPSARSIAENRAVAEAILGTPSAFETRAMPARPAPQEPLAQMTNPSEARRNRFAAAFASAAADNSIATSAKVARRLSDEQLYDSIRRFGASGNSVSFKF